ncbi:nucleotidyltransferase domain-containing protein [Streptomyces sulphureus]|uniref:nucleotidyltransferase domain-containing protein n=1 Tax=Streptomyces sulphureus TaxID=47758 RepID=UPI00036E5AFF|nr:nucleotidyltransferase family protein [Streptomyces sulphureus]
MGEDRTREIRLILDTARPHLTADDVTALRALSAEDVDWAFVLDQAFRHRVLPLFARNFVRYQLHPEMLKPMPSFLYEELLVNVHHANEVRNEALVRELGEVLRGLRQRGVEAVVRKGAVLGQEVYGDIGARRSYDIDLIVEPDEVPTVREELEALGYGTGGPAANRRTLAPLPRAQSAFWALRVPNLAFRRTTSERFVGTFVIDVCLNQFLPGSGYDLPPGNLRERSRQLTLFGFPARAFTHEEMLVDLATHLFKEATTLHYVHLSQDLTVAKFLDLAMYARHRPVDWPRFVDLCHRYGIAKPVYFALHYTRAVYPDSLPDEVLSALRPPDTSFLHEIGAVDKLPHQWQGDLLARMFDNTRAAQAPPSPLPF